MSAFAAKLNYSFCLCFVVYDAEPWFYADITRQECEEMLKQVTHFSAMIFKFSNIYYVCLITQASTRYVKKLLCDRLHFGTVNRPFSYICCFHKAELRTNLVEYFRVCLIMGVVDTT